MGGYQDRSLAQILASKVSCVKSTESCRQETGVTLFGRFLWASDHLRSPDIVFYEGCLCRPRLYSGKERKNPCAERAEIDFFFLIKYSDL